MPQGPLKKQRENKHREDRFIHKVVKANNIEFRKTISYNQYKLGLCAYYDNRVVAQRRDIHKLIEYILIDRLTSEQTEEAK